MKDILWNRPDAFWLLWSVPLFVALAIFAHKRTRAAAKSFAGDVMQARLLPPITAGRAAAKLIPFVVGMALSVVVLAGPAWDAYFVKTRAKGVDVVIALDVSRSMLADDGGEARLDRARAAVEDLVTKLRGDRVGLLLFAGTVLPSCPLTFDRAFLLENLRRASPEMVGRGGTRIGPALDAAEKMLDVGTGRDRLILLVSDAGDQESLPKEAAGRLAVKKVRIVTLGIGRSAAEDAPLIIEGKVVRDKKGQPVKARVNEPLLAEIATTTAGMYVPPAEAHRLSELYDKYIQPLAKGEAEEYQEKHFHERFQWFLLPAVLAFLVQLGRPIYPRTRRAAS